ncbi:MAG: glycosyltransferase family 4 protein [Magnetospirillum sp.]|nr:glycosyltransferase family 4 protein [Magnetospirillum sp.]
MKVGIAVHGRFHAFELAAYLYRQDLLARLDTTYPAAIARRFLPDGVPLRTQAWLEVLRRAWPRLPLPGRPDLFIATRFARALAKHLPEADILVGWSGAALEAIRPAQARGMKVVLERGSTHIAHQTRILAEAHARWGVEWNGTDPRLIQRELAEYAAADLIVTGCASARQSFLDHGIDAAKLAVNPYGVDLSRFHPASEPRHEGKPRILFVGSVGVRKGVPWLIQAMASLPPSWELHLVGPMEPGFQAVLAGLPMDRVVLRGPLHGAALADEYRAAQIFCLPSVEEGFGMVILQAMASGLPVVASAATGAPDAGICGRDLMVVPPADSAALAEALADLAADPDRRRAMGVSARSQVAAGFNWSEYGQRAVCLYRRQLTVD